MNYYNEIKNKIIDNEVYEKVAPLLQQLSWSHYAELLSIKDENKNFYYIKLASTNNDTTIKKENKNELL